MTVRILIVDDHPFVRAGLRAILEATDDLEVVAEAADGPAAMLAAEQQTPDVVLMDLSMPGGDGIDATRRIVGARPATRVVILTSFRDSGRVQRALQAGAVGYVLKDTEPHDVLAAVRAAVAGHVPIDPRAARALLPDAAPPRPLLSRREEEVLGLIAEGLANKQIATRLGISERTVKVHVGNLFRRIGVADRTSAALWLRDNPPEGAGEH